MDASEETTGIDSSHQMGTFIAGSVLIKSGTEQTNVVIDIGTPGNAPKPDNISQEGESGNEYFIKDVFSDLSVKDHNEYTFTSDHWKNGQVKYLDIEHTSSTLFHKNIEVMCKIVPFIVPCSREVFITS
eukprot:15365251-Ditylum_brightwellii.AAC.2